MVSSSLEGPVAPHHVFETRPLSVLSSLLCMKIVSLLSPTVRPLQLAMDVSSRSRYFLLRHVFQLEAYVNVKVVEKTMRRQEKKTCETPQ